MHLGNTEPGGRCHYVCTLHPKMMAQAHATSQLKKRLVGSVCHRKSTFIYFCARFLCLQIIRMNLPAARIFTALCPKSTSRRGESGSKATDVMIAGLLLY